MAIDGVKYYSLRLLDSSSLKILVTLNEYVKLWTSQRNSLPGWALSPSFSTLSTQTLLSLPSPTFAAQDCLLFLTKASWITGIFLGMSCAFIECLLSFECLLLASSFHAPLIALPVTAPCNSPHDHLLLGPGILARHQINSKVWKKTDHKIIR